MSWSSFVALRFFKCRSVYFAALLLWLLFMPSLSLQARDYSVGSYSELRNAIRNARDGDKISLTRDITMTGHPPHIDNRITVEGNGNTISGNNRYRIFVVAERGDLTIRALHLIHGRAAAQDPACVAGADWSKDNGGAICSSGSLTVNESSFSGNSAVHGGAILSISGRLTISGGSFSGNSAATSGGAIYSEVGATISESSFSDNSADYGGAIYSSARASLSVNDSSFSGNSAANGGAIYSSGGASLSISNSSFSGNSAQIGGAIYSRGDGASLSVSGSSFSGNSAGNRGGAIYILGGTATLTHLTLMNNRADESGGGIAASEYAISVRLRNSILANNAGGDCAFDDSSDLKESLNNIIKDGSCGGNGTDPRLGGWVPAAIERTGYFPLLPGSPAIDAAADTACTDTDPLGAPRPYGSACDIGAIEYVPPATPTPTATSTPTATPTSTPTPTPTPVTAIDLGGMAINRLRTEQFLDALAAGHIGASLADITCGATDSWFFLELQGDWRAALEVSIFAEGEGAIVNQFLPVPLPDDGEKPSQIEAAISVIEVDSADTAFRQAWSGRFYQPELNQEMNAFWAGQEADVAALQVRLESTALLRFLVHVKHANGGGARLEARHTVAAGLKYDGEIPPMPVVDVKVC